MLLLAGSSCGFQISVILHVAFGRFFMRILNSCDSACCFRLIFHADSRFSRFCMLLHPYFSCGFSILAFLHVVFGRFFMQILDSRVSACCFRLIFHADSEFLRFCMLLRSDSSCRFQFPAILHVISGWPRRVVTMLAKHGTKLLHFDFVWFHTVLSTNRSIRTSTSEKQVGPEGNRGISQSDFTNSWNSNCCLLKCIWTTNKNWPSSLERGMTIERSSIVCG